MRHLRLVGGIAAGLLFGLTASASSRQMSGGEELKIEKKIQTVLQKDADLKNNQIDVGVDNGVATLKGKVDTQAEREKAERLARVSGVVRVDNQLDVGSEGVKAAVTDGAITGKLKAEFLSDKDLASADVSVTTNNGVVTLSGTVPSDAVRQEALDTARKPSGVRRVEDNLHVSRVLTPIPNPLP